MAMRELERAAGTSDSLVRLTETKRSVPTLGTVEKLAKALKVNAAWLAFGLGPRDLAPRSARPAASAPLPL
jgi:transcriptional regulator with XRE-family HTH domain